MTQIQAEQSENRNKRKKSWSYMQESVEWRERGMGDCIGRWINFGVGRHMLGLILRNRKHGLDVV